MEQTLFYLSKNGEEIGPFAVEKIKELHQEKELGDFDFVYVEEKQDWIALKDFLSSSLASAKDFVQPKQPPVFTPTLVQAPQTNSIPMAGPEFTATPPIFNAYPASSETPEVSTARPTINTDAIIQEPLNDSYFEIEISNLRSGNFKLHVSSEEGATLIQESASLAVTAGPAHELRLKSENECTAGRPFLVQLVALDEYGDPTLDYSGVCSLNISGAGEFSHSIPLTNGRGSVEVQLNRAGNYSLRLLTELKTHQDNLALTVRPAELAKFTLLTPNGVRAGEKIKVKVMGLDRFGNQISDVNGQLKIDIASSSGEPLEEPPHVHYSKKTS